MVNLKLIVNKLETMDAAWAAHGPDGVFAGLSLEQFRAATKPSRDERATIESLDRLRSGAFARRTMADIETQKTILQVVNSVRGNPEFGEDSDLYRSMGYVTKEERKSGLTRKRKTALSD